MAGTIKAKIDAAASGMHTLRFLLTHPMQVERQDAKTGKVIAAHIIEEVVVTLNGEVAFRGDLGQSIAMNPFFIVQLRGARTGDKVAVAWRDDRQQQDSTQLVVP